VLPLREMAPEICRRAALHRRFLSPIPLRPQAAIS
jgi:hypothetical protein